MHVTVINRTVGALPLTIISGEINSIQFVLDPHMISSLSKYTSHGMTFEN